MSQLTDAGNGLGDAGSTGGRRRKRALLIALVVVAVIALVLTGGSFAYAKNFDGKALPGTQVMGQDMAGKTADQIAAAVQKQADGVTVTVTADGKDHEASLADLGVDVDAAATGKAAASHDGSVGEVLSSTWSGTRAISPVVTVDDSAAADFADGLVPDDEVKAKDASVTYDEAQGAWTVVKGRDGKGVDAKPLIAALEKNAANLQDFSVDQPIASVSPAITDKDAQKTVDAVTKMLDTPMSISGPDGVSHEVSKENRNSWISVKPDDKGKKLTVSVDKDAVHDWVAGRADEDSVDVKNGIEQVDENGKTVEVIAKKADGLKITNTDKVTDKLVKALSGSGELDAAFDTQKVKAEVTKAKAPSDDAKKDDKAGKDADDKGEKGDKAKPSGEKWIDVNLTDKTVTAYVGDTPVWGPRTIVDGKPGNETATGSYEIYLRHDVQDMTNAGKYDEDDPRYYYTKDVPWVQYWHNGYAFHGAPWRSSFGYSGSHGCINMTVSDAKWLYDWASIGTRVEVHR
jgi:lipoprotein-anchoring transpeptidase ErfK/SrfK